MISSDTESQFDTIYLNNYRVKKNCNCIKPNLTQFCYNLPNLTRNGMPWSLMPSAKHE